MGGLDITAPPQSNDRQAVHPSGNSISFAMVGKAFANLLEFVPRLTAGVKRKMDISESSFFRGLSSGEGIGNTRIQGTVKG